MSLVKKYIQTRKDHESYFRDLSPNERLDYKEKIIHLKHLLDEMELSIINNVLSGVLNLSRIYSELKKHNYHSFIDKSERIQNYRINRTITDSIGYRQEERRKVFQEFEKMCHQAWEDYIITAEERQLLDEFCVENNIDRTQQTLIEGRIAATYSSDINLIEAIEYYFLEDNRSSEEIKLILKKEYKKNVEIDRIIQLTSALKKSISSDDIFENDNLIKTLTFQDTRVYIMGVNQRLNSGYEFEISYIKGDSNNFKILVQKSRFSGLERQLQVELITDAICYKTSAQNHDSSSSLKFFLEQKPLVRAGVDAQY
jgi:hypothetical protein